MISGYATPKGTKKFSRKHKSLIFNKLGRTGLLTSQVGFGGYRISQGVQNHEKALTKALKEGINLIDTSANYADGGSEKLVGQVLNKLIDSGTISREDIIVVSKGGYLQGKNYELSQERKREGIPFDDLVPYSQGLEHCIHPEFLHDQIRRSLNRLGLETLDVYLLHNPEYYLSWANHKDMNLDDARTEYYRRIQTAFLHLEKEVQQNTIRYYGISSNTFPGLPDSADFTGLQKVLNICESLPSLHHFHVIQLPFNLLESGAGNLNNQPAEQTVLQLASKNELAVIVNRPLNAFSKNKLIRLAEIDTHMRQDYNLIIKKIRAVIKSEAVLWRKILPEMESIPQGLKVRIKEQISVGDKLKYYWRNFGSYEKWREVKDGVFQPRIQGVMDFLEQYEKEDQRLSQWLDSHLKVLETAFKAVASIYSEEVVLRNRRLHHLLNNGDPDWTKEGTLSQKAIRSIRSTKGVSTVLVGMRKVKYVKDVIEELKQTVPIKDRKKTWKRIYKNLAEIA